MEALERLQKSGSASASEVTARQRLTPPRIRSRSLNNVRALDTLPQISNTPALHLKMPRQITQPHNPSSPKAMCTPLSGTVYSLPVSRTEFVEQGKLLLQMADLSHIQVRAYFDEPELGKLAVGQPIKIIWDAKLGRAWRGHIARVPSTIITYGTRNVGEVLIAVEDSDGASPPQHKRNRYGDNSA